MISFTKYSATGNDFVVVDNRDGAIATGDVKFWQRVCDRHFGVGADGVLFLEASDRADYRMRYLNADGGEVSMCGNGARALCHYYRTLVVGKGEVSFETANGFYQGEVLADGRVSVLMSELYDEGAINIDDLFDGSIYSYYLNTGVPHCVYEVMDVEGIDIDKSSRPVRHDARFKAGTNVNYYERDASGTLIVRTFERGVEGETLSCGTGIVACAITEMKKQDATEARYRIRARGGELQVRIKGSEVYYEGTVEAPFSGKLLLAP